MKYYTAKNNYYLTKNGLKKYPLLFIFKRPTFKTNKSYKKIENGTNYFPIISEFEEEIFFSDDTALIFFHSIKNDRKLKLKSIYNE